MQADFAPTYSTATEPRVLSRHPFEWNAKHRKRRIEEIQNAALILGLNGDPDAWEKLDRLNIHATTPLRVVQGGRLDWRVVAMPKERR